jgi:diguanylate cyclase (GGDEF)-like protein
MDEQSIENIPKEVLTEQYKQLLIEVDSLKKDLSVSQVKLKDNSVQIEILLRQIDRLRHDGKIDKMTNLFNNNYLEDSSVVSELESLSKNGIDFGIIFIDLNDLKKINDSKGHKEGDKYIIESSKALVEVISARDTVVRKGGDEFVVIVRHINSEYLPNIENTILDRIKLSFSEKGISASLGFALSSECGHSLKDTINLADQRMYIVKKEAKK